MSFVKLN